LSSEGMLRKAQSFTEPSLENILEYYLYGH
jgi:hypothetical protein